VFPLLFGYQEGHLACKNRCLKIPWKGRKCKWTEYSLKYHVVWIQSFSMSREDAQDKNDWRLGIRGQAANPDLPRKRPLHEHVCSNFCLKGFPRLCWVSKSELLVNVGVGLFTGLITVLTTNKHTQSNKGSILTARSQRPTKNNKSTHLVHCWHSTDTRHRDKRQQSVQNCGLASCVD